MEPVRLGVVGAGGIATAYAQLLPAADYAAAHGVADVRADAAQAMAADLGCPSYGTPEGLLDAGGLDAIVLCTPPVTHPDIARLFLEAGVAVLCEKPLAVDRHHARAMLDMSADAGVPLAMATKFRFCDDVRQAKELVATNAIGEVRLVEISFTSRVDMSSRWNSDPAVSGGGVLVDNGTHAVDLGRYLVGPIAEVLAVETSRPEGFRVDDTARLFLRHESGIDAAIDLSWSIDKCLADFLRIYGTTGEIRVGWRESAVRQYGVEWRVIGPGYVKHAAMGGALRQFCSALRDGRCGVNADEALAATIAVDAAYRSLAEGSWVKLAEMAS